MESIFEAEFAQDPRQSGEFRAAQERIALEVDKMVAHERSILDHMIRPSTDSSMVRFRLDALKQRRIDTEMIATGARLRDRKARRFIMVAGGLFLAIPLFGLLNPYEMYLSANTGTEFLYGYNTTFAWFIAFLATAMMLSAKAAMTVFEPWISRRMKQFDPDTVNKPKLNFNVLAYWRLVFIDRETGQLRIPQLRKYYRVLPVTTEDIRGAALEHLYGLEVRRLMNA